LCDLPVLLSWFFLPLPFAFVLFLDLLACFFFFQIFLNGTTKMLLFSNDDAALGGLDEEAWLTASCSECFYACIKWLSMLSNTKYKSNTPSVIVTGTHKAVDDVSLGFYFWWCCNKAGMTTMMASGRD
jgi:hypothetical protein